MQVYGIASLSQLQQQEEQNQPIFSCHYNIHLVYSSFMNYEKDVQILSKTALFDSQPVPMSWMPQI